MLTARVEPPVTWEIFAISYEKSDTTEGASKKITEVKAKRDASLTFRRFTKIEIIDLIDSKQARFITSVSPKPEVKVVPSQPTNLKDPYKDRYLRSDADNRLSDNLGALPEYDAAHERLVQEIKSR